METELPIFCIKISSIKARVIEILSTVYPLTINDIHSKVSEISKKQQKYHTVYETIKSLEKQGILKRKDSKYLINYEWILRNKDYINNLQLNYARTLNKDPLFPESTDIANALVLTYNSLEEFDDALKSFENNFIEKTNKKNDNIIIWRTKHSWWSLLYMKEEIKRIRRMKKNNTQIYFLIEGNTPLDKWVKKIYTKHGVYVKTGCKSVADSIVGIYNDKLLFIVYPYELMRAVDFLFDRNIDVHNIDIGSFFQRSFTKKMIVYLIVVEDKIIADKYRKYLLSKF